MGKVPKVIIWFKIISECPEYGVHLPRYFNVAKIDPKNSYNGLI